MNNLKRIFFKGFVMFILLGVAGFTLFKIVVVVEGVIAPLAATLGIDRMMGKITLTFLTLLVILLLILLLGLLMRIAALARIGRTLEDTLSRALPSLEYLKTMAAEKLDVEQEAITWKAVMLLHQEKYHPAFIIEEMPGFLTFYVITGNTFKNGEIWTIAKDQVMIAEITADQIRSFSRRFGKGYATLVKQKEGVFASPNLL